jgi:hypothetical protein
MIQLTKNMKRNDNLAGKKFGRLTVVKNGERNRFGAILWDCVCECGGRKSCVGSNLTSGRNKSCGCIPKQLLIFGGANRKHGWAKTPEYNALHAAISRCKKDNKEHANYFDRGIRVCKQWSEISTGIQDFVNHIGRRPSPNHSLDRINNDKGYEPGNVRWATRGVQLANRRKRLRIDQFTTDELIGELRLRGLFDVDESDPL